MNDTYFIDLLDMCNKCSKSTESTNIGINKSKYAFIRLYKTIYKSDKLSVGSMLKQGTKVFSEKTDTKELYTHAAIYHKLTDKFVGLNLDPKNPNDIKIESLSNPIIDAYSNARDYEKSEFTVLAYPLTDHEYMKLEGIMEKVPTDNKFKYDIKTLFATAFLLTKRRAIRLLSRAKEDVTVTDDEIDEEVQNFINGAKRGFICSTFVAYVLMNTSERFKAYLQEKKISVYEFSPNSLFNIPGTQILFRGHWNKYNDELKKFVQANKQFLPYTK